MWRFYIQPAKKLNTFYRKIKSIQQSQKSINMSEFAEVTECVICYESIGSKNCCTTECGHQFCFKCIATSMQYNNACPYCRASLVDMPYGDDESEDDEEDESDDESEEDEESEEEEEDEATPEEIAAALQEKGITMGDLITLLTNRCSKTKPQNINANDHMVSIYNRLWDVVSDLDAEAKERGEMMNEEIHAMAVALGTKPISA